MEQLLVNDDFVHKYSKLIYFAIRNRAKKYGFQLSHEEISDIRQDLFVSLSEDGKLASVEHAESMPFWLAIVSGNAAMLYLRRSRRHEPVKSLSLSEAIGDSELIDLIPSLAPDPSELMQKDELVKRIAAAIELLPAKEKLITKLHLLHDKKQKEIATILSIPPGTVSTYIMRAKKRLRSSLRDLR